MPGLPMIPRNLLLHAHLATKDLRPRTVDADYDIRARQYIVTVTNKTGDVTSFMCDAECPGVIYCGITYVFSPDCYKLLLADLVGDWRAGLRSRLETIKTEDN